MGYPSIRTTNIKNGRLDLVSCNRVDQHTYEIWTQRRRPVPGDLILAREAPVGEVGIIPPGESVVLGQRTVLICPTRDKIDPHYLLFIMIGPEVRHRMSSKAGGSTVDHLNMRDIRALPLPELPSLSEQRAIAGVLRALDDRIEVNRKMARVLEGIARTVFRSWFVDFDPVRRAAAGQPTGLPADLAALFPKRLVDSPIGEAPDGWKAGTVVSIAEAARDGVDPGEIDANTPCIGLEHMPRRNIALDHWSHAGKVTSGKSRFRHGQVLFGKLRPYFHKVGVAPVDGVCSTDIIVAAPQKPCWAALVLGHLSSDAMVQHADRSSSGTKMPRTNWRDLASFQIAIPPEPIAARASEALAPLVDRIIVGIHQNRTLTTLRDTLLPKLISGELRIPDAERIVSQAT